jgi:hypothetical protein
MSKLIELAYWCQSCRSAGIVHCAHPEYCGAMKRIPTEQAAYAHAALRARASQEAK